MYIALIKSDGNIYIMANNDFSIRAFESETEAVRYFEDGYNSCHKRSYEASMSAVVNWLHFQPSIIHVYGIFDIKERLIEEKVKCVSLGSIAGRMKAIECKEGVEKIWDEGIKPKLI